MPISLPSVATSLIEVNVDAAAALGVLRNGEKRMAFAIANAINKTALDIQTAERRQLQSRFTLRPRGRDLLMRDVAIIKPFASAGYGQRQQAFYATISVGQKRGILLPVFELGGTKEPGPSSRYIAVPDAARPSWTQNVPADLYVSALRLGTVGSGGRRQSPRARGGAVRGLQGTYVVPGVGIFQRVGRTTRMLYAFAHNVTLRPRLDFAETAKRVVRQKFQPYLLFEMNSAFKHAWGVGL